MSGRPKVIRHEGRSASIAEWARSAGLKPDTLRKRLARGVPISVALETAADAYPQRPSKTYRKRGRDLAHRLIVEAGIGMKLPATASIHHVNGNIHDNSLGNLVVCNDEAHHQLIHYRQRALSESGNANNLRCRYCKRWDSPENIVEVARGRRAGAHRHHRECHAAWHREYRKRLRLNKPHGDQQ